MALEKIADIKVFNDTFVDMLEGGQEKKAAQSALTFTRNKLRENSFFEKILTPIDIANDELDKSENPELHVKWCDREPDQPAAVTVPLGTVPDGYQFSGTRYPVYFSRLMSPVFQKDIDKLRGYDYDIRQVLLENSTKDLATEVDSKGLEKVNSILGVANTANSFTGTGLPSYISLSGGINRANWSFWRPIVTTGGSAVSATTILAKMTSTAIQLVRGTDKADLIVADNNYYSFYVQALQAIQRITSEESGASGFASLKFYGGGTSADVVLGGGVGSQATANTMFFLNTDYIFLRPHKERNFVPIGGERQAINQDAIVKLYGWAGNLTCSNQFLQGKLIA